MKGKKRKHLRYVGLQPRTLRAYRLALSAFLKYLGRRSVSRIGPGSASLLGVGRGPDCPLL